LLSVPYRKALPDMSRAFQFADHRDGVILNRNLALAGGVYQKQVVCQAELSSTLSGLPSEEGKNQEITHDMLDVVCCIRAEG
jgi:hypothetical protein